MNLPKLISQNDLSLIRSRSMKASPGPWKSMVEGRDHTSGSSFIMIGADGHRGNDIELSGASIEDQDFIAHARQDIPFLLDEVERLNKILSENFE